MNYCSVISKHFHFLFVKVTCWCRGWCLVRVPAIDTDYQKRCVSVLDWP